MAIFGGIKKSFKKIFGFLSSSKIDEDTLELIEETLFAADIGIKSVDNIVEQLREEVKKNGSVEQEVVLTLLKQELTTLLDDTKYTYEYPENGPLTIMIIGVNGVGKTTSIAKIANKFQKDGKKVVLAACDTFRAGAVEQISLWGERIGCRVVQSGQDADPASVAYDAYSSAKANKEDVLIIDTAGRLHNKAHLMRELDKIFNVLRKHDQNLPHETFMVLDSTTGKNGVEQAKTFNDIVGISGIILTKLDGTAKGGSIFPIKEIVNAPVRYITTGEKVDDIEEFDAQKFVESLLE